MNTELEDAQAAQPTGSQSEPKLPGVPDMTLQLWTVDGYPIVDGKYLDLRAGELKKHPESGETTTGPPLLGVYWHNTSPKQQKEPFLFDERPFYALGTCSLLSVTEYLVRVGDLLRTGVCTVKSLNATKYEINLLVQTELTCVEFGEALRRHGLTGSGFVSGSRS